MSSLLKVIFFFFFFLFFPFGSASSEGVCIRIIKRESWDKLYYLRVQYSYRNPSSVRRDPSKSVSSQTEGRMRCFLTPFFFIQLRRWISTCSNTCSPSNTPYLHSHAPAPHTSWTGTRQGEPRLLVGFYYLKNAVTITLLNFTMHLLDFI